MSARIKDGPLALVAPTEQTFTPFPKLPAELRDMIWTLHHLSTIKVIRPDMNMKPDAQRWGNLFTIRCDYDPMIPVCAESRRLVEKNSEFITAFNGSSRRPQINTMHFRPGADIIFLGWEEIIGQVGKRSFDKHSTRMQNHCNRVISAFAASSLRFSLRRITVDYRLFGYPKCDYKCPYHVLMALSQLPRLALIEVALVTVASGDQQITANNSTSRRGARRKVSVSIPTKHMLVYTDTEEERRHLLTMEVEWFERLVGDLHRDYGNRWIAVPEIKFCVFVKGEAGMRPIDAWVKGEISISS